MNLGPSSADKALHKELQPCSVYPEEILPGEDGVIKPGVKMCRGCSVVVVVFIVVVTVRSLACD